MEEFNDMDSAWEDEEERQHVYSVIDSFYQYRQTGHLRTTHVRRQNFYALSTSDWTLLSKAPVSFLNTLNRVDDAIDANACIAEAIADAFVKSVGLESQAARQPPWKGTATPLNLDKARSTIHQLYRDWSSEGNLERSACFEPVFDALTKHVPRTHGEQRNVLVPGCGLGRLVYELVNAGYCAEGNELSYHQIMTQAYILNKVQEGDAKILYPFALSFANVKSRNDQLRQVLVPDVPTGSKMQLPPDVTMSMTMGDFCEIYSSEERSASFDAVATVFFVDTASNPLKYIRTIRQCLRPGGVWVNVGPLLWHHASSSAPDVAGDDHADLGSVELSDEELIDLVRLHGFSIQYTGEARPTGYVQNPASMLQSIYHPSVWTAVKVA